LSPNAIENRCPWSKPTANNPKAKIAASAIIAIRGMLDFEIRINQKKSR